MITGFLLKKKTNPTPSSPISCFKKKKQPLHATMHIHHAYEVAKSP
jgi:hypothetical protein